LGQVNQWGRAEKNEVAGKPFNDYERNRAPEREKKVWAGWVGGRGRNGEGERGKRKGTNALLTYRDRSTTVSKTWEMGTRMKGGERGKMGPMKEINAIRSSSGNAASRQYRHRVLTAMEERIIHLGQGGPTSLSERDARKVSGGKGGHRGRIKGRKRESRLQEKLSSREEGLWTLK